MKIMREQAEHVINRRMGGLETSLHFTNPYIAINRRMGGLEIWRDMPLRKVFINRRMGGLEK